MVSMEIFIAGKMDSAMEFTEGNFCVKPLVDDVSVCPYNSSDCSNGLSFSIWVKLPGAEGNSIHLAHLQPFDVVVRFYDAEYFVVQIFNYDMRLETACDIFDRFPGKCVTS